VAVVASQLASHRYGALVLTAALGGAVLTSALRPAGAESNAHPLGGKLHLSHQTWVQIDVQLVAKSSGGRVNEWRDTMRGRAGENLASASEMLIGAQPVTVGLAISTRPDRNAGTLLLRIESEVHGAGLRPTSSARSMKLVPGRVGLAELWRDPSTGASLVAVLSGSWEEVPQLTPILPGAEPIDLVIELVARDDQGEHLLEQHRLGGLVGSPSRYELGGTPGASKTRERFAVEVLPESLRGGDLLLTARLMRDGEQTPVALLEREELKSGFSLDLSLPLEPGKQLIARITPFF
jgi:hypothetical protein